MGIALAGADVRHDLAWLHAAILGRAARPPLEEFEQREIEILVQRLAGAHDLVAVIERALDPGDRHIDGKRFRIGFALGPAMRGNRIHDLVKDLLVLRLERLVEIGAVGATAHLQPSCRREIDLIEMVGAQSVRGEDLVLRHPAIAVFERDAISHVRDARLEMHLDAVEQRGKRIGLREKAQPVGLLLHRVAHARARQPDGIELFEKGMDQRLVGTAEPRMDS
jgi:hypothetical protein